MSHKQHPNEGRERERENHRNRITRVTSILVDFRINDKKKTISFGNFYSTTRGSLNQRVRLKRLFFLLLSTNWKTKKKKIVELFNALLYWFNSENWKINAKSYLGSLTIGISRALVHHFNLTEDNQKHINFKLENFQKDFFVRFTVSWSLSM